MTSILSDPTSSPAIAESSQMVLYTTHLPRFRNKLAIEVFEQLIQKMYDEIYELAHKNSGLWQGKLFNRHKPYSPQTVVHSNPRKLAQHAAYLVEVYKLYTERLATVKLCLDVSGYHYDLDYDVIKSDSFSSKIHSAQVALIKFDSKKKTDGNVFLFRPSAETWNERVISYLLSPAASANRIKNDSIADFILKVLGEHKKSDFKASASERKKQAKAYKEAISEYNPKELLHKEVYQDYQKLTSTIDQTKNVAHLLTAEEMHIIETIEFRLIPDGLKNIQTMVLLNSSDMEVSSNDQFMELVNLGTAKLEVILQRLKDKAEHDSQNYYTTNKQLLEL